MDSSSVSRVPNAMPPETCHRQGPRRRPKQMKISRGCASGLFPVQKTPRASAGVVLNTNVPGRKRPSSNSISSSETASAGKIRRRSERVLVAVIGPTLTPGTTSQSLPSAADWPDNGLNDDTNAMTSQTLLLGLFTSDREIARQRSLAGRRSSHADKRPHIRGDGPCG
jgi:hypothetical protein